MNSTLPAVGRRGTGGRDGGGGGGGSRTSDSGRSGSMGTDPGGPDGGSGVAFWAAMPALERPTARTTLSEETKGWLFTVAPTLTDSHWTSRDLCKVSRRYNSTMIGWSVSVTVTELTVFNVWAGTVPFVGS